MDQLYDLLEDIATRSGSSIYWSPYSEWDGRIEFLEEKIDLVPNRYSKQLLRDRYIKILYSAKKVPTIRAQSYPVFRDMLMSLSEHTVELETKGREEM